MWSPVCCDSINSPQESAFNRSSSSFDAPGSCQRSISYIKSVRHQKVVIAKTNSWQQNAFKKKAEGRKVLPIFSWAKLRLSSQQISSSTATSRKMAMMMMNPTPLGHLKYHETSKKICSGQNPDPAHISTTPKLFFGFHHVSMQSLSQPLNETTIRSPQEPFSHITMHLPPQQPVLWGFSLCGCPGT